MHVIGSRRSRSTARRGSSRKALDEQAGRTDAVFMAIDELRSLVRIEISKRAKRRSSVRQALS